ncbi:autoinducer 2 ABC transporter substrate-binding protein [Peribacillus sp. NPDC097206]|uniref:autoinducer 2 ABC transporter substrate-binding protein n=1 Tax=unclassified Peribacillus TaxID=2675266 RepID=UPI003815EEA1
MRRVIILSIILIVSACSNHDENDYRIIYKQDSNPNEMIGKHDEKQATIAIIPKVINIPYFNAVKEGVNEAAKALDVHVIYEGPVIADANQQIAIIEKMIAKRVDVIAVSANDPVRLIPVLKKARKQSIKVITWDADTNSEGREYFINMVNPETLGRHLMDILAWNTGESGEFAIMTGAYTASNLNEWLKWIQTQLDEYYPNMNLVEIVATDDDPHKAYMQAKELLRNYPRLKGIIGNSSVGPPAAAQAVKELKKIGKVSVVGLSSPNSMNDYLKEGSAQMITLWSPKKLGYLTVAIANNLNEGIYPYDKQEIVGVGKIQLLGEMVIMGEPIDFTKENVDQYDF